MNVENTGDTTSDSEILLSDVVSIHDEQENDVCNITFQKENTVLISDSPELGLKDISVKAM